MNLSKSRYTLGMRCEKLLWLSLFKPEEADDLNNQSVLDNGNAVGDLARHLFGDEYILIDFDKGFESMIEETKKSMEYKPNIICEASFDFEGNFCSVDILKNDEDGIELYEVKSSTEIKDIYIDDISYQTWVLKKLGYSIKKSSIVYVNNEYIKKGNLDLKKFFIIEDVTNLINLYFVEQNIKQYKDILNVKNEPHIDLSMSCQKPYKCPFFGYCTKHLVHPNVFDLEGVRFDKKLKKYKNKVISFEDILKDGDFTDKTLEQVRFDLEDLPPKVEREQIKELLDSFTYPLYFLDFETYQEPIPIIDGTRPYQQITFQYSLHYIQEKGGELIHKEYLSDDYDGDPREGLAKKLCEDIPPDACVLAYNMSFEKGRITEMAYAFPELSNHLLSIRDNIKDLLPPFRNHIYYTKEMHGSASIKSVLPALFPNDPTLDYHNLEGVHKGDEASETFLELKNLSEEERIIKRNQLLKYCELDTYAMVKIFEKLQEVTNEFK